MVRASNSRILRMIPLLIAVCLFNFPIFAQYGDGGGTTASVQTNTYIFLPGQSTVVQTGGIAGVHETYPIQGQFQLKVDVNDTVALFGHVDAFLLSPVSSSPPLSLGELFNMPTLVGEVLDDTTISFTGKADDGSDVLITVTIEDDLVYLAGETIPPPNSADFFLFSLDGVAQRKYGGGTGEPNEPYRIATAEDLMLLGESPEDYDKHFVLTADIDLDPNLPGRKVFDRAVIAPDTNDVAVGFQGIPFTGIFDGNGKEISHLTIAGDNYLGLFGLVGGGGQISNLGLENVTILGGDNSESLGGIAGENRGMVTHCYAIGNISGGDGSRSLGGLVGYNRGTVIHCYATGGIAGGDAIRFLGGLIGDNNGTVTNCYADSTVTGGYDSRCLGGLLGLSSRVTHCYATGTVVGGDSSRSIGGLIGALLQGTVTECYAATSASGGDESIERGGLVGSYWEEAMISNCYFLAPSDGGGPDNGAGVPLTNEQIRQRASFVGWDFVGLTDGPHDIWAVSVDGGYPILWWQLSPLPASPFSDGTGESNDPFLLSTADELSRIGHNPRFMTAHFSLTDDIDLAGVNFFVIGSELYPFTGVFEGNGHKISNLKYTSTDADNIGLFGYVKGRKAEIKDLVLIDPNIDAGTGSSVGSLVGSNGGTISNCHVQNGSVAGYSDVGGLAGGNSWFSQGAGRLINCSATGKVSSTTSVGGLVGLNSFDGTIIDCYARGNVAGDNHVGGLVGQNCGTITNSYASGGVSGDYVVGGLVAYNYDTVTESFATAAVSGASEVGGMMGINVGAITNCYSTGSVLGDSRVGGLVGCNAQMHAIVVPCQVVNCYSIGSVSGNTDVGGLVGEGNQWEFWVEVMFSFWDIETSGLSESDGGMGKTTAEMQTASTFLEAGWDFVDESVNGTEDIWWINEGQDYPRLWWEP